MTMQFGPALARMRAAKAMSQLSLSLTAEVSARHISFLETGRSLPTHQMVSRLARALELEPAQRAELVRAAGFWEPPQTGADAGIVSGPHTAADLDAVLSIEAATTIDEAASIAGAVLARIGLTQFFAATLAPARRGPPAITRHHVAYAPVGWLQHYRERDYLRVDPLVRAAAARHLPFFWNEVEADAERPDTAARQMFADARSFRIEGGFVMPVRRADGRVHVLSCMAERLDTANPRTRAVARTAAIALLHRLEDTGASESEAALRLTQAECDWLSHLLEGRSVESAARQCRWSESETQARARQVCDKLGAEDALMAALRARRLRLLSV